MYEKNRGKKGNNNGPKLDIKGSLSKKSTKTMTSPADEHAKLRG